MASSFAHAFSAIVFGKVYSIKKLPAKFWILGIGCSILPDADVLAFKFGIPYEHVFGHRGITHSLFFAVVLGLILSYFFFKEYKVGSRIWWGVFLYFFVCTASHGLLDAMTTGGKGVAFFAPFENSRYFLPWRPITVASIYPSQFFTEWGLRVLKSEALWVGLPGMVMLIFAYVFRMGSNDKS
ncbi:MAG: metal-dependent hydrolase [Bacteroidota bacterium]